MVKHPIKESEEAHDVDTETRILDAAHAVFLRAGTAGARMQEIADEAGVNKALLHYYFRNKERLAAAVFERVARGLFARVGDVAISDLPLDDKVRQLISVYLDQFARTPYAPGYLICEMNQNPDRAGQLLEALSGTSGGNIAVPFLARLGAQIQQRVDAGEMRPIPPRQLMANLVSLCIFPFAARPMFCAVFRMDDRGFREFIEERKATLAGFFLNALRP